MHPFVSGMLRDGVAGGQQASYFALENDYWRVISLDTGYNTYSKMIDSANNTQPQAVVDWLRDVVKLGDASDPRGIVLLSHHQYYSAFEDVNTATPDQISPLFPQDNRTILWLWGHEHRLALYDNNQGEGNTLRAYGRCVGTVFRYKYLHGATIYALLALA
jgi:hypothetical protein